MFFDAKARLAEIQAEKATPATSATLPPESDQSEGVALLASSTVARPEMSAGGRPKTWTGKVISLEEWRNMRSYDKYGHTSKHWNGLTQQWENEG